MTFSGTRATCLALITLSLGACVTTTGSTGATKDDPATTPRPLGAAAHAALARAQEDIQRAQAAFALWTSAESAYKQAVSAAAAGNDAQVIEFASVVAEQVALGLAQKRYPSTEK